MLWIISGKVFFLNHMLIPIINFPIKPNNFFEHSSSHLYQSTFLWLWNWIRYYQKTWKFVWNYNLKTLTSIHLKSSGLYLTQFVNTETKQQWKFPRKTLQGTTFQIKHPKCTLLININIISNIALWKEITLNVQISV